MRKSKKGLPVWNIFKQVFCFFLDGTSRGLVYFDQLKQDGGYAAAIENDEGAMASSHTVKRFFQKFPLLCGVPFRLILKNLFVWRLLLEQPDVVWLTIDTMVMNNDEAVKRHGVSPTYKKVKGFQPLQVIWDGKIVDAIFRGGKKHSNSGDAVMIMLTSLVKLIRKHYKKDAVIVICLDSGFFDEAIFSALSALGVAFIATGKMYSGVKEHASQTPKDFWGEYDNGHQKWEWAEFGYRGGSWKKFYRAFYTKPLYEGGQMLLDFARPDNVILTNIGTGQDVFKHLSAKDRKRLEKPVAIIRAHHMRGKDELPHRGLKDFGFEQLPFKWFAPNTAFYYCMLISFFLFETFKKDVLEKVVPITSYASTVRRRVVDIAGKVVRTGGRIILKLPRAVMDALRFEHLWEKCQSPPLIPLLL